LLANGKRAEADAALQELMVAKPQKAYYVAANLAYRGEADLAFQWLEKAYSQRETSLISDMTNEPFFAKMQKDPRYMAFRRKMNVPD
jgi:hypothetical protein